MTDSLYIYSVFCRRALEQNNFIRFPLLGLFLLLAFSSPLDVNAQTFTHPLTLGNSGQEVTALQQLLVTLGFLNTTPSGYYGRLTFAAVKAFQKAHSLEVVGSIGPQTRAALNAAGGASTSTQTFGGTTFTRVLTLGSTGSEVTALQTILHAQGYLAVAPSGYYGTLTFRAVAAFQTAHGLEAVGSVGPLTRALLNATHALTSTPGTNTPTTSSTTTRTAPTFNTKPLPGYAPGQIIFGGGDGRGNGGGSTPTTPTNKWCSSFFVSN
jgi:peptidoglycan hydrolase-like protein with peptidoglycan-binding domain